MDGNGQMQVGTVMLGGDSALFVHCNVSTAIGVAISGAEGEAEDGPGCPFDARDDGQGEMRPPMLSWP